LKRRSDIVLLMRILEEVRTEPRGPTRLAQSVNLSFDKCAPYLRNLEQKGLITKGNREGRDVYSITQAGIDAFLDWQRFWERWMATPLKGASALTRRGGEIENV
jgi:predicted transcriptional regulator